MRFRLHEGLRLGESAVITAAIVLKIFTTLMGCWALGYGMGKAVAYVRALANAV